MKWFDLSILLLTILFAIAFDISLNAQGIFETEGGDTTSLKYDSNGNTVTLFPAMIYAQRIKEVFAVSTINRNQIERISDPTIERLLNSTPGLWMQSGTLSTNRISIRGVGYREPFATTGIKVYLDEIPLTNGVGESSIEDIHPLILEGIDIWRGPASAIWGSGLGGAIHLKSAKTISQSTTRLQGGSFGRIQFDQTIGYELSPLSGPRIHYQYLKDDGYRDNNEYRKHSGTWSQPWRIGDVFFKSFFHIINLEAFIPSSLNKNDYENNPGSAAPAWAAVKGHENYTKWIGGLNTNFDSETKEWLYRVSFFATSFESDEVRPFNVLDEGNFSYGTRFRVTRGIKDNVLLNAGFELFGEKYDAATFETLPGGSAGEQLSSLSEFRYSANLFLQGEIQFNPAWDAFAGLHSSYSRLHNREINVDLPVSLYPTIGIEHRINRHFSIAASASRGYTALALDDMLNSTGMLNKDVIPETGWNKEFSISVTSKSRNSRAKVSLFHMNIDNTIITKRIDEDQFEKLNGGSSVHRGVELDWKLILGTENLSWSGAYTFNSNHFKDFVDSGNDYSGNHLPGSPDHHAFNRIAYEVYQKFSFSAEHHWLSGVYLTDDNTIEAEGYQLVNVGGEYPVLKKTKSRLLLNFRIHNLFDVHYSPMFQINALGAGGNAPRYYYPGKPRSFYLGLVFNQSF